MSDETQDLNDEQQQFEDEISVGFDASASETEQQPEQEYDDTDWRAMAEQLHEQAEQAKAETEKERQRFLSLQGKYNAEVPALHAQLRDIQTRIESPAKVDDDAITVFRQDYPAIAQAVDAITAQAVAPLRDRAATLESTVTQVMANETRTAEQQHFDVIHKAHKDWETRLASPEFNAWANAQPSFSRDGIQRVLDKGTAGEVIELLTQFKGPKPASTRNDPPVTASRSRQIPVGLAGEPDKNDLNAGFQLSVNNR